MFNPSRPKLAVAQATAKGGSMGPSAPEQSPFGLSGMRRRRRRRLGIAPGAVIAHAGGKNTMRSSWF